MAIKNEMEFLVKAEVQRCQERSGKEEDVCWCSLCETDVVALALNQLPPRYCHEKNYGYVVSQGGAEEVRGVVSRAVQKVSQRPKHRPGKPQFLVPDIRMENYAKKFGDMVLGAVLSPGMSACACDQCRADTLAYALNRYPPKYGVSYGGRESYQSNYEDFIRHEIGQVLTESVKVIRERPHH